ncbi:MAG: type II toxin-antitoxin system VapB family antitoxin [Actinomycetota bacterium]|nr:type II toxin-antitoxin system VapB family antitoxin [Actinomycetota bacterium]
MTKRLVDIDDDLLEYAQRAAGTPTIKATVDAALKKLVEADVSVHHIRRLRQPGAVDLEALDEARAPRTHLDG